MAMQYAQSSTCQLEYPSGSPLSHLSLDTGQVWATIHSWCTGDVSAPTPISDQSFGLDDHAGDDMLH